MAGAPETFNPFPGLRAFESSETHLFFGRDGQNDELLRRLGRSRFLAVVGSSGSGKSSLVRAGMLPSLRGGFMVGAGSKWHTAFLRPGHDPTGRLAEALNKPEALGPGEINPEIRQILFETTLRRSSLGLVEAARQARMEPHENLLIVVDQFEEIFRFKTAIEKQNGGDEAGAFVKLLLEATRQTEVPIYVVLTMRSDFLGDCAQFRDLPEVLNDGQYLIPRMTRGQRREAVEAPVAVGGAEITPRLVQRLLNDVGDDPDQLPILQHALMRTWEKWRARACDGESIDLEDYESIGGMATALSRHADEAFEELADERSRRIAQKLFQCLSEKGPDNREVRRPTKLREICAVAEADEAHVLAVIDRFRSHGQTFLMPPEGESLTGESVIDIAHESLIRLWTRLRGWVEEEARSARIYQRLADAAVLHEAKQAALLRDPELQLALDWKKSARPNEAWASRYNPAFETAVRFLEKSRKERDAAKRRRRAFIVGLCLLTVILAVLVLVARHNSQLAQRMSTISLARQLAAQANLVRSENAGFLELSALLAVESMRRFPLFENDEALRQPLMLLAKTVADLRHEGGVNTVVFSPDGRYVATGSDDKRGRVFEVASSKEVARLNHQGAVYAVAFSWDGRFVATGSLDKTARVFEVAGGNEVSRLIHDEYVVAVVFSPDGHYVASGSHDKTVRVFEAATGKEISRLTHDRPVQAMAFSPDGRNVATGSEDGTARLFEAVTGKELSRLNHQYTVHAVAFSPDGSYLVTGSMDGTARVFQVASGKEVSRLSHQSFVNAVAFSPNGRYVATGSYDRTARVFEASTGNEVSRLTHQDGVKAVAFGPDGRYVATGSMDNIARVFKAANGNEVARLTHQSAVVAISFSPDGKYVATGSSDQTARVFEVANSDRMTRLSYQGSTRAMAFNSDGRYVASGIGDQTVRVFDTASGTEISRMGHYATVESVALSTDGGYAATWSEDNVLRVFEATSGKEMSLMTHSGRVHTIAFSPDARRVATASGDQTARVFEWPSRKEVLRLSHENAVVGVAFSPDGRYVVTGSEAPDVRVFDATTGKEVERRTHRGNVHVVAFSPDGRYIAAGSGDQSTHVFDAATGKVLARLTHQHAVNKLAFSPDGRYLAIGGSMDPTARVFEAATGNEVARLTHQGFVLGLVFGPEGRHLTTVSGDAEVIIRHHLLRPQDLIKEACARLTRNVTPEEWKQYLPGEPYRKTCPELP